MPYIILCFSSSSSLFCVVSSFVVVFSFGGRDERSHTGLQTGTEMREFARKETDKDKGGRQDDDNYSMLFIATFSQGIRLHRLENRQPFNLDLSRMLARAITKLHNHILEDKDICPGGATVPLSVAEGSSFFYI